MGDLQSILDRISNYCEKANNGRRRPLLRLRMLKFSFPLITYIYDHNRDHGLIHDLLASFFFLIDRQNTTLKLLPEIVSFHHCNLRSCDVY